MRVVGSRSLVLLASAAAFVAGSFAAAEVSAAEILSVKNESANFREGPGEKHPIVFAADRFYPVETVEKKDGWLKVKDFEGDVAWVAERLLARQEAVVVEGDKVNVRDKASTSAEIVFKAERGEVFKVEERQGKWLKVVDANGDGGWIRDDMVWGERAVTAAPPKGKTKGELEDPAREPSAAPPGKGDRKAGDKAEKKSAAAEPALDPAGDPAAPEAAAKAAPPKAAEPAPKAAEPAAKAAEPVAKTEEPAAKTEEPEADAPKAAPKAAPEAPAPEAPAPEADAPEADAPDADDDAG